MDTEVPQAELWSLQVAPSPRPHPETPGRLQTAVQQIGQTLSHCDTQLHTVEATLTTLSASPAAQLENKQTHTPDIVGGGPIIQNELVVYYSS